MEHLFYPSELRGHASLPCSKSEVHRRLICAALADGRSVFTGYTPSADATATAEALRTLGAVIHIDGDTVTVTGMGARRSAIPQPDCEESASTLRFLLPLCLHLCGGADFRLHGHLADRPLDAYRQLLEPEGVTFRREGEILSVRGRLKPGRMVLDGNISSQFVSGMLFALPLLPGDSSLRVENPVSEGYIGLTEIALAEAGIRLQPEGACGWKIPGRQRYRPVKAALAADLSAAAVWLCANRIGHRIEMDLPRETAQPDAILTRLPSEINEYDVSGTPDLMPPLSIALALSPGRSVITGCGRLKHKESDRLRGMADMICALGGHAQADEDRLILDGVSVFQGGVSVHCLHDHRLVMAAALAATRCRQPVAIDDTEALDKSWPDFLNQYRDLGGICK